MCRESAETQCLTEMLFHDDQRSQTAQVSWSVGSRNPFNCYFFATSNGRAGDALAAHCVMS